MKRFLLDTHSFLWWITDDKRLGATTKKLLSDGSQTILVSVVSAWEIEIKRQLGKLRFDGDVRAAVEDSGFVPMHLNYFHTRAVCDLEMLHRDPFDRMLLAQSIVEKSTLITADSAILRYPFEFQIATH